MSTLVQSLSLCVAKHGGLERTDAVHLGESCYAVLLFLVGVGVLGTLLGLLLIIMLHRRTEQLAAADTQVESYRRDNEELKRLAVDKDNFVASLAHEMRTPLNGIQGMLQLAKLRGDMGEVQGYIDRSLLACEHLAALLDDTLDVKRLEQGRAILNVGALSLPALARSCIELAQPAAARKRIELDVHIEEEVASAGPCEGDARRLTQVLLNLLTNAVKFTPDGGRVSLSLATRPGPGAKNDALPLMIRVRDTGIGIAPDDIERVFLKYTKAAHAERDEPGVDRHAGAGLGLSICKAIVEQHRGKIGVESTPGEGSTFTIILDLPLAARPALSAPEGSASAADVATQARDDFSGCRVLVADDVAMNRDVVGGMLDFLGCTVVEVRAAH